MSAAPEDAPASSERHALFFRWGRIGACVALLGALCAVAHAAADNATPVSKEYQIKAAFLYNFTKFVEWPPACFPTDTSSIVIGVLGRNPFGHELEKIVGGRVVNGRAIVVKLIQTADEVSGVHLLFVPAGEETRLSVTAWKEAAVVAAGESESFAALGGTITFVQAGDKVRFEINIAAAERGRVKISSQLQKLATAVRHQP